MKKRAVLSAILSVILILALCGGAAADLKRGSRGDAVKEMQQMMIDLGVLNGAADGMFGKKTQTAVRQLQRYWGMKQSGRADEAFMNALNDLWHLALGNGTESGADPEEDLENPVKSCAHNESAPYGYDYCYLHDEAKALRDLLNPGQRKTVPDGLKKVVLTRMKELWLDYIGMMYDEWEQNLSPEEEHVAQEQRELFQESWEKTEAELAQANGGPEKLKTLQAQADWLETIGIEHCFDLHGAEPNGE